MQLIRTRMTALKMGALAVAIGLLAGYGAALFTLWIHFVRDLTVARLGVAAAENPLMLSALIASPVIGLILVAWLTRKFAPEAEGHGVPEVIVAVARNDGKIRPRVSLVKVIASGLCIGTGGSVGREGPIVQIGSSLGSMAGQWLGLPARQVKVLVAAGAAAGISATFNAPLAGVVFASEIILGSFAVTSLTPIVVASVIADVVQLHIGEHGFNAAFPDIHYVFLGVWSELPSHCGLGVVCGFVAAMFIKSLYAVEDLAKKYFRSWLVRALVCGLIVGIVACLYPKSPIDSNVSASEASVVDESSSVNSIPALYGVGYPTVETALRMKATFRTAEKRASEGEESQAEESEATESETHATVWMSRDLAKKQLFWLLPLVLLKPIVTSLTLAGGGSGGVFAPSLFIGATTGAAFGLACNLLFPGTSAHPGLYAIVGMGAVVAGTTHGVLSAILIVYEMTDNYQIILPIMVAAGLASAVSQFLEPESIYYKKLSRRGESIARSEATEALEHIMVRDVMIQQFPVVRSTDDLAEIVRIARKHADFDSLPVLGDGGHLVGIIRPEDLHRVLDAELPAHALNADDIASPPPTSVSPNENLLEALMDFGTRDAETLPVEIRDGADKRLVGLLIRDHVMRRYRQELLKA